MYHLSISHVSVIQYVSSKYLSRGLPNGSGLGLSRCLGPGECLHSFIHSSSKYQSCISIMFDVSCTWCITALLATWRRWWLPCQQYVNMPVSVCKYNRDCEFIIHTLYSYIPQHAAPAWEWGGLGLRSILNPSLIQPTSCQQYANIIIIIIIIIKRRSGINPIPPTVIDRD